MNNTNQIIKEVLEELKVKPIKELLYPNLENHPKFYLFESKYPRRKNFTEGFLKLCKDLKVKANITLSITRYAYDSSDNTAWVLFFGDDIKELERVREQLYNIEYNNQKVFNISGNGYGTGLSVMLNYNKFYK
jgi:hypothetical protein